MIKILTVCILTILLTPALPAEVFRFRYTEGLRYNMITEVLESVYIDGAFANQAEILNKITVSVEDVREGSGLLSGTFRVSELAWGSAGPYRVTDETYHSLFWRDPRGRYSIDPQYIMPIVRNIPLFPEDSINPGESWIAEGEEVHDLRVFGIRDPLRIPLSVRYLYVGKERREEREIAVFEVSYYSTVNTREGAARGSSDWEIPEPGSRMPLKIKGSSEQIYRWDIERGIPYSYKDRFDYIYILSDGRVVEFEGTSIGRVVEITPLDTVGILEDIRDVIRKNHIEDVEVTADEEGVTLILEDINFSPESDYLNPAERKKLEKLSEILESFPERDLLITGHTALAGTPEGRLELSESRARAVADYLLLLGVRERHQISVRGMGADQPRGDNRTEEGRRKNRRVEIKILEE